MNPDLSHLAPAAAALLRCTDGERIAVMREERWITYPRARRSLELLNDLLARLIPLECRGSPSTRTAEWERRC
jgi:hypothetical protein